MCIVESPPTIAAQNPVREGGGAAVGNHVPPSFARGKTFQKADLFYVGMVTLVRSFGAAVQCM